MRYLIPVVVLVLAGCKSDPKDADPGPTVVQGPAITDAAPGSRTLQLLPLRSEVEGLPEETRAGAEAALREILGSFDGRYRLMDEGAEIVVEPVLRRFSFHEVGAGSAFTMRDLGVDPGPDFIVTSADLKAVLKVSGESVEESVVHRGKGGTGTPGVSREDRDGDGRLDLSVGIEGQIALLRPALRVLALRMLARTHPPTAPVPEGQ